MSRGFTLLVSIVVFWHAAFALLGQDLIGITQSFA